MWRSEHTGLLAGKSITAKNGLHWRKWRIRGNKKDQTKIGLNQRIEKHDGIAKMQSTDMSDKNPEKRWHMKSVTL